MLIFSLTQTAGYNDNVTYFIIILINIINFYNINHAMQLIIDK